MFGRRTSACVAAVSTPLDSVVLITRKRLANLTLACRPTRLQRNDSIRNQGVQNTSPLIEMRGGDGQGEDDLPNTNTRYSFRFDLRVTLAREVASACHARTRHHHFDRLVIKANKNTGLAWKSRHTCRFGENTHKCHVWVDCRLMRVTF